MVGRGGGDLRGGAHPRNQWGLRRQPRRAARAGDQPARHPDGLVASAQRSDADGCASSAPPHAQVARLVDVAKICVKAEFVLNIELIMLDANAAGVSGASRRARLLSKISKQLGKVND